MMVDFEEEKKKKVDYARQRLQMLDEMTGKESHLRADAFVCLCRRGCMLTFEDGSNVVDILESSSKAVFNIRYE